eukprot:TRINITY_DN9795_c0_g1_i1.p1 TRINITY_DN9795_c0_g1~~TRINITY_DN9795_c0_g1_i1.p1  ORF type:complete len:196 (+),score=22.94 TRINITY_DN9795_c0_g1_i1:63-650(+)
MSVIWTASVSVSRPNGFFWRMFAPQKPQFNTLLAEDITQLQNASVDTSSVSRMLSALNSRVTGVVHVTNALLKVPYLIVLVYILMSFFGKDSNMDPKHWFPSEFIGTVVLIAIIIVWPVLMLLALFDFKGIGMSMATLWLKLVLPKFCNPAPNTWNLQTWIPVRTFVMMPCGAPVNIKLELIGPCSVVVSASVVE